jgi:hypothetical protein
MSNIKSITLEYFTVQQQLQKGDIWESYSYHPEPYTDLELARLHIKKSEDADKKFCRDVRYFQILKQTITTVYEVIP